MITQASASKLEAPGGAGSLFISFVAGEAVALAGEACGLVDPAAGRIWGKSFIDATLAAAADALEASDRTVRTPAGRAVALRRPGDLAHAHAADIGGLASLANGKPHSATLAEFRAAAQWRHDFASAADLPDSVHRPLTRACEATIVREPPGVVVAITPLNGAAPPAADPFAS